MDAIARLVAGRRSSWIVLLAGLVAIGLALLAVPHPSVVAVQGPATAGDSQRVAQWQAAVPSADLTNAIVVWSRSDAAALSPAEQAQIKDRVAAVAALSPQPKTAWAQLSTDRKVILAIVPITSKDALEDAPAVQRSLVDAARSGLAPDLRVRVTGDLASLSAASTAARDANGTLETIWLVLLALVALVLATGSKRFAVFPTVIALASGVMASLAAKDISAAIGLPVASADAPLLMAIGVGVASAGSAVIVLRYRAEWPRTSDRFDAGSAAWAKVAPWIAASALFLAIGSIVFLFSPSGSVRALGLASAVTVLVATLAVLIVVPAALVVLGRFAFLRWAPSAAEVIATPAKPGFVERRTALFTFVASILIVGLGAGGTALIVAATASPADPGAGQARAIIDRSFITGYGNQTIMIVPSSLKGETSIIAPTTLAMNLPGAHSVTVGPSRAGRTELITYFDIDPGSAKSYATIRTLRSLIASTGGPTATSLVGGSDAAAIDRGAATAQTLTILLPAAIILAALLLFLTDWRERRLRR